MSNTTDQAGTHVDSAGASTSVEQLEQEGDIAADYLEGLLDIADIDGDLSDPDHKLHFMLPGPERFAEGMARLGIGDDTKVVCYATAFHWWATRFWWMLRVFGHDNAVVLDGGFQRWQAEGRPVETGPAAPRPRAVFTSRFHPEMVADRQDVLTAIGAGDACVVNALRPEQHAGAGATNYGRPGHITGSISVVMTAPARAPKNSVVSGFSRPATLRVAIW